VAAKLCRDADYNASIVREKLAAAAAVLESAGPNPFPHCSGCYAALPDHRPAAHVRLPARMMLLALCADCAPGAVVEAP